MLQASREGVEPGLPVQGPPSASPSQMGWRPWGQKGSRATGRPTVQVRGAVGGAPSLGRRTVTPLAPSPSVREGGTLMVTLAGRFQEASHLCTHTQGQGCGALGTSRGKHRFPPCLPPRETSPGPLFLGRQQPLPWTWPSSRPSEPNSEGALSSLGVLRPGLAWPGPSLSLVSLQGHRGWRPPGTHGNMNNKFRFFQFYNMETGFQTAAPCREVGVWLYEGSGEAPGTHAPSSPQDSLPGETLAMSDDARRPGGPSLRLIE